MAFSFQKANQSFDNLPFKDRFKAVGALVKNTFSVIGRDEDIIKPWIRMAVYNFFMVTFFFYAIAESWVELPLNGLALFLAIILFIYKHFYHNRQEVRMSWTVYKTIIGEDPSYKGAKEYGKQVKSQTRKLAWLDIAMALMNKGKFVGGGVLKAIMNLIISGMQEVWDLINHYLLPSVAIDQLDIGDGVKKMKKLKDSVPESLVGVFGIDFMGKVVGRIMVPVYIALFIIAGALSYFAADYLPTTEFPINDNPVTISPIPLLVAFYIGKLFSNLFERVVTSVKVVYFTVFYTKITHPDSIMEELRGELTNYLKLDELEEVENLDKQEVEEVEAV